MPKDKKKNRSALWRLQGGRCAACGEMMVLGVQNDPLAASLDHVIPKSKGGTNQQSNLLLKHRKCNNGKADELPTKNDANWLARNRKRRMEEYREQHFYWRYLNNTAGPKEPPRPGDEEWLGSEWEERE